MLYRLKRIRFNLNFLIMNRFRSIFIDYSLLFENRSQSNQSICIVSFASNSQRLRFWISITWSMKAGEMEGMHGIQQVRSDLYHILARIFFFIIQIEMIISLESTKYVNRHIVAYNGLKRWFIEREVAPEKV